MSLNRKLVLLLSFPGCLVSAVMGAYLILDEVHTDSADPRTSVGGAIAQFAGVIGATGMLQDDEALVTFARTTLKSPSVLAVMVLDADRRPIVDLGSTGAARSVPLTDSLATAMGGYRLQASHPITDGGRVIGWVRMEYDDSERFVHTYRKITFAIVGVTALIIALIAVLVYGERSIRRPLVELRRWLEAGATGAKPRVADIQELRELAASLEVLVGQIRMDEEDLRRALQEASEDHQETLDALEIQNIQLEKNKREAETANRATSAVLANLNYEVRSPLNSIVGFTNLLLKSRLQGDQREYGNNVKHASQALLAVIKNLLDFARLADTDATSVRREFDLRQAVDETLTSLLDQARDRNVEVVTIVDAALPSTIAMDLLCFQLTIAKLLASAIAKSESRTVVLRLTKLGGDRLHMTLGPGPGALLEEGRTPKLTELPGLGVVVAARLVDKLGGTWIEDDDSRGYACTVPYSPAADTRTASLQDKRVLFYDSLTEVREGLREFFAYHAIPNDTVSNFDGFLERVNDDRVDYDLLMIGLNPSIQSWADQLADLAAATPVLFLVNDIDPMAITQVGARPATYVSRPIVYQRLFSTMMSCLSMDSSAPPVHRAGDAQGPSILVVDDNASNLRLAVALLEDLGHRVDGVGSGHEALIAAKDKHFDIIFMDLQMPGLDGLQTTERLRAEHAGRVGPRIIALTAHALPSDIDKLLGAGMDDYLIKPITEAQLTAVVADWALGARSGTPSVSETDDGAELAVVDWELARSLANGNDGLAREMLTMLAESLPDDLATVTEAHRNADTERLEEAVHRINGACRYCGVPRLRQTVESLETAIKTRDQDTTDRLMSSLQAEADRLEAWLAENG